MQNFAKQVAALSQKKRDLLRKGLKEKRDRILRSGSLSKHHPLSFAQQRLWFLDQLEPNSPFYNLFFALRLQGQLSRRVLTQTMAEILHRHEALRTTFPLLENEPVQMIALDLSLALPVIDLTALGELVRETTLKYLIELETQQPFVLARGPLLRWWLFQVDVDEHILLVVMHHIISDGWSMGVFAQEASSLYRAFSAGQPSPLDPLPIQYADFTRWQRHWLQGEVLETQLDYWKHQLAGMLNLNSLPTDRPRPPIRSLRGDHCSLILSRQLNQDLRELSRREGVTLFMLLLAAFQLLLARHTQQEECVVGTPIANRTRGELEGLIGFFINTLVLRTNLSGNPTFSELLKRVKAVCLDAYMHQELPFEKLIEELQPERDLSISPLFQVMFALQNYPIEELEFTGLTVTSLHVPITTAKFDLSFFVIEKREGLVVSVEYNSDLFEKETILRLIEQWQVLLRAIVQNAQIPIHHLPLLTEAEQEQILHWQATLTNSTRAMTLHEIVEQLARGYCKFHLGEAGISAPLEKPIANPEIHIFDEYGHQVPIGMKGELYLGGDGLTQSFLHQAGVASEHLISHPYRHGERLYRTGYRARWLSDGSLEVEGRMDQRVYLHGYPIELGRIETTLLQHSQVQDAVVMLHTDQQGESSLVTYLVAPRSTSQEISAFAQQHLPAYMRPSAYTLLDKFPLTFNGAVDRQALALIPPTISERSTSFEQPQGELEQQVARIWQEVLGVEQIGRHENFFALGGHSLLAARMVARLQAQGEKLSLRKIFECPTIAQLAAGLQDETDSAQEEGRWAISRADRGQRLPLSFAQEQLWFLEQWEPGSSTYMIPWVARFKGPLHIQALEKSLSLLVARHEGLRTCFVSQEGIPSQHILPFLTLPLPFHSFEELAPMEQVLAVQQMIKHSLSQPFLLDHAPLLRVDLVRLGPEDHVLVLIIHHIIIDGWSLTVLAEELSQCYQALSRGDQPDLPPLKVQPVDVAIWQRERLQGERLEQVLAYWRQQLAGVVGVLHLATDHPRPAIPQLHGARQTFVLPDPLWEQLHHFCQREQVTLFMGVLTALVALLSRYSGQEDLVIGAPLAQRQARDLEPVIGFFVNTMPLRIRLKRHTSFRQLLEQVRQVTLEAYEHQDLPFEKLISALQIERDPSISPLFQVVLALQNQPSPALELPGLHVEESEIETRTTKFDLVVSLQGKENPHGEVVYNADLFEGATISRLIGHLLRMIGIMMTSPDLEVEKAPYLSEEEYTLLVKGWNQTDHDDLSTLLIHDVLAQQPLDAVAAVFEENHLTYGALHKRANQLAHLLQRLGVGPEVRVGICVERSLDLLIGLLAIFKAGGAYVALDPGSPVERLAFLLADSQVAVLLTQQHLVSRFTFSNGPILTLDTLLPTLRDENSRHPNSGACAHNLAYIIYTSGSTGRPKGVEVTHASLMNLLGWHQYTYQLSSGDRATQLANLGFDASVWEIWPYLAVGACVYFVDEAVQLSPRALIDWLQSRAITFSFIPTPLLEAMFDVIWPRDMALKALLTGGDTLKRTDYRLPCPLINHYGPTENTVVATFAQVKPLTEPGRLPPIGRPITNTQVYLLDAYLQPVPIGVAGNVYLGGKSLARGYLQRPDLTAERFLPHPFSGRVGERLYNTGDLARYLPDGTLEFLGRQDNQVKLRGYRIELGEIESILLLEPMVQEAVVIMREDVPDNQRLVAYVVPKTGSHPPLESLRTHVEKHLPPYMVPTAFVLLASLPFNERGKLDQRSLPSPASLEHMHTIFPLEQRDLTEMLLAQIWEELLGITNISVTANFFALGGHSLLAVRLMALIENHFKRKLPLSALFQRGTIREMAALLRQERASIQTLVALQPQGERPPLFFVHAAGGHLLSYVELSRALGRDYPFYGFQAPGLEDDNRPLECIEDFATFYITQMRTVQPHGPYYLGGWSAGGLIAFEMAQQLKQQGEGVAALMLLDTWAPLSQQEGGKGDTLAWFAYDLAQQYGKTLLVSDDKTYQSLATEQERFAYIFDLASQMHLFPAELQPEQARKFLRVFLAIWQAVLVYRPRSIYDDLLLLIRASDRTDDDEALHWHSFASQVYVVVTPGTHYSMVQAPDVEATATLLRSFLQSKA